MVDQAKVKGRIPGSEAVNCRETNDSTGLAGRLIELCELQVQLLTSDAREASQAARRALGLFSASLGFLIAALPVLVLALAAWLQVEFEFGWPISLGMAGAGALIVSGLSAFVGWKLLSNGGSKFARSQTELRRNLAEIKQAIVGRSH